MLAPIWDVGNDQRLESIGLFRWLRKRYFSKTIASRMKVSLAFCAEMLKRYRDDERVMHVNGTNFIARHLKPRDPISLVSTFGFGDGRLGVGLGSITTIRWRLGKELRGSLNASFDSRREQAYWIGTFDDARRDWRIAQAWDFPWIYSCWTRGGLAVTPSTNLVENLGFGSDATHTTDSSSHLRIRAGRLNQIGEPSRYDEADSVTT
jgi:hypothetical protein